jgi:hypothetical protein
LAQLQLLRRNKPSIPKMPFDQFKGFPLGKLPPQAADEGPP